MARARLALVSTVYLLALGCLSDDDDGDDTAGATDTGDTEGPDTDDPDPDGLPSAPAQGEWMAIEPAGETVCSRGTPYRFFVRGGRSDRVIGSSPKRSS